MQNQKMKQDFAVEKRNISMFVKENTAVCAAEDRKEYILDFQMNHHKKTVFFMESKWKKRI